MKVTVECEDGIVKTIIPAMPYEMSPREYDSQLLMIGASVLAAIAERISDNNEEVSEMVLDTLHECARQAINFELRE